MPEDSSKDLSGLGIPTNPLEVEKFKRFMDGEDKDIALDADGNGLRNGQLWRKGVRNLLCKKVPITPSELLYELCEYFDSIDRNPLYSAQLVSFEGNSSLEAVPKMRVPTLYGICNHLGIHRDTWGAWRRGEFRPEFKKIVDWAENKMADDKFAGAAAGLLNPVIISRDLGLAEKSELTSPDGSMTPRLDVSKLSTRTLSELQGLIDQDEQIADTDQSGEDGDPA